MGWRARCDPVWWGAGEGGVVDAVLELDVSPSLSLRVRFTRQQDNSLSRQSSSGQLGSERLH